jgi:hypothetical protein
MVTKKTVTSNNSTVSISGAKIIGNNNDIFGDDNEIIGNNNNIEGHNNKCMGNNLDVIGDYNKVTGNNNDVEGYGCEVVGNNCDYVRKKKPKKSSKSITEHLDDMLAEAEEDGKYVVSGSRGRSYGGRTPEEALARMDAGEKAHFEIEQARLDQMAKVQRERIEYEAKMASREWKIDNINLTDEEYEEVAEYMESIKELWQTW